MASQGSKRKALTAEGGLQKKRCSVAEGAYDSTNAGDLNAFSEDISDEETHSSSATYTPLTSISHASTPRYPSNLKTIPCTYPDCEKAFNRQAKLIQHLNVHTNTRPFVCTNEPCTKAFFRSSHLKHHIKSAHSNQRDYVCQREGCNKRFATGTRLKRHQELHAKRQQFACIFAGCGQEFRKHNTLQKHIAIVHEGNRRPFVCDRLDLNGKTCGASFEVEGNLRTHVNTVHCERSYFCTACPLGELIFPSLSALQAHVKANHPPMCHTCGVTFTSSSNLEKHLEAKHSNEHMDHRKQFICPEPGCEKTYTLKTNLTKHVKNTHEESKSFVCGMVDPKSLQHIENWDGSDACGRALTTKYNLINHIRNVHLRLGSSKRSNKQDENPDPVNNEALMRLTGIGYEEGRDIECLMEGCPHRFPRDYDLQRHLQSHHHLVNSEVDQSQTFPEQELARNAISFSRLTGMESMGTEGDGELQTSYYDDYLMQLEDQAATGGTFWLGGQDSDQNLNRVCERN